jgi:hypothetical protein
MTATQPAAHPATFAALEVPNFRRYVSGQSLSLIVLTVRKEVTDRMLVFGQRHLRTILAQYETHYNGRRPQRSRRLRPPQPDHLPADLSKERIRRRPVLGGLINEYERAA